MHIDNFFFGNITIDGKKYVTDVYVFWDGEILERKKSHDFTENEFLDMLMKDPEIVIIGTGTGGCVIVDKKVEMHASLKGVKLIILKTPDAIQEFNKLIKMKEKVAAMFHLTC
ncbi:MAG: hypothetical protein J7K26_01435 [Candidatus Aenigmarchaeota archaeon]|nr:hypothetical protein [Candidatus Aenigmarchaeota archaeon]